MMHLIIRLGRDSFAIETTFVREVLPFVEVTGLPGAVDGLIGLINHRGDVVPVVDLNLIACGVRTAPRLSTRIIVTDVGGSADDERLLGLLVPRATEVRRMSAESFASSGVESAAASFIGGVVADAEGLVQKIRVEELLTDGIRRALLLRRNAA